METQVAPFNVAATTILTLEMDADSQRFFEQLRQQHYPKELNRIPAHITLFHKLPPAAEVLSTIESFTHREPFILQVTGLRSLGRGVAYTLASPELSALHAELYAHFQQHLTPQDRQRFAPHIVVQNKATPEQARTLLAALQQEFSPFEMQATGLHLWDYLNGPWQHAAIFNFC